MFWKIKKLRRLIGSAMLRINLALFLMILNSAANAISLGLLIPLFQYLLGEQNDSIEQISFVGEWLSVIEPKNRLAVIMIGFMCVMFLKSILMITTVGINHNLAHHLWVHWADVAGRSILFGSYRDFVKSKPGELVHNYLREPFQASRGILALLEIATSIILGVAVYAVMLLVNWKLTITFTALSGFIYLLIKKRSETYSKNVGKERQKLTQDVTAHMTESISLFKIARSFSLEKLLHEKSLEYLNKIKKINVKFSIFQVIPSSLTDFVIVTFIFGYIIFGVTFSGGRISQILPELIFFAASLQRLYSSFSKIFSMHMKFISSIPSFNLIDALIKKSESSSRSKVNKAPFLRLTGDVVMKDITFGYQKERIVLKGVNVRIQKGKVTIFFGKSGSGKSTLVDILMRFLTVNHGTIYVGEKNIEHYSEESWRNQIGYVNQDVILFNDSIVNNIRYGKFNATNDEVVDAAKKAHAHDFILELPNGYDTLVGDRGEALSGGQKQRISIARALVRNPEILILDEATSALDPNTEMVIIKNIMENKIGMTIVLITHRQSLLPYADVVYKIENGVACKSNLQ